MTLEGAAVRGATARAIQHHYDVDNAFYALWLDETRSYSCALFLAASDTLELAQLQKLDFVAREARACGARRVLDIGCGWGGLLNRLKDVHGVPHTVGLTLSKEQWRYIRERSSDAHDVRLESWQEHETAEPYDAIVSVGAFEHFARPDLSSEERIEGYRSFFRRCHGWLRPGGRMCLQTICYDLAERAELSTFFRESVFPESDLPRPEDIFAASRGLFHVVGLRNDAEHYADTLAHWRKRLRERRQEAEALVGERVVAHFLKYLALSRLSFQARKTGLLRVTLQRTDDLFGSFDAGGA